jgi:hypothetical protein
MTHCVPLREGLALSKQGGDILIYIYIYIYIYKGAAGVSFADAQRLQKKRRLKASFQGGGVRHGPCRASLPWALLVYAWRCLCGLRGRTALETAITESRFVGSRLYSVL